MLEKVQVTNKDLMILFSYIADCLSTSPRSVRVTCLFPLSQLAAPIISPAQQLSRVVPAEDGFPCDKAAELGDMIKGTLKVRYREYLHLKKKDKHEGKRQAAEMKCLRCVSVENWITLKMMTHGKRYMINGRI